MTMHKIMIRSLLQRHQLSTATIRSISSTPTLHQAMPAPKQSSEEPKTAQKKVKTKEKGASASKMAAKEAKTNRLVDLMTKAYDAPVTAPPKVSEEEMAIRATIGRNHVIGSFKRHNEQNHDLAVKIRMKRHAMKLLPREGDIGDMPIEGQKKSVYGKWRAAAFKVNDNWGPPDSRPIPLLTPPIEGFDASLYMDAEDET
mmetsp:Transcript_20946/g.29992  ORF Transcript_20946/g.29992 Transcript_20946/m.29992 type:complete len:200 (-) Transcript_20946:20-619(-)|eukprot:CAMPEP_0201693894 /NCGR_PEP_ID=MMETSP0578-20130828/6345_1 /ASSEMBLY_ACC=CAM_ASM_000663 /TAXON_ID=267565 /ORGANISM="Skeletonema grethea, Strain CCMP 1804" /LENGTH=199 /DNA_ID=CAMNT_0048179497 /DNA_START=74 /DNA_END=673 /DNA_ORIENTATION=-